MFAAEIAAGRLVQPFDLAAPDEVAERAFRNLARAVLANLPPDDHDLGSVEQAAVDNPSAA